MSDPNEITAREFESRCLELLDQITETREGLVITKRGRPIARLEPVATEPAELFGALGGSVVDEADIVSPIGEAWHVVP